MLNVIRTVIGDPAQELKAEKRDSGSEPTSTSVAWDIDMSYAILKDWYDINKLISKHEGSQSSGVSGKLAEECRRANPSRRRMVEAGIDSAARQLPLGGGRR